MRIMSCGRTNFQMAAITIPDSTALGSADSMGAIGRKAMTAMPVTRPDHRLCAPARRFRLVREREPPTGSPPVTAATTFAIPLDRNSLSASQCWRSSDAKTLEIDTPSAKPITEITSPGTIKAGSISQGRSIDRIGKPDGISPTVAPV